MPTDLPSESTSKPLTPEVSWAQRSSQDEPSKNFVWITILASDVADMKLDIQPTSVTFSGHSTSKKADYAVTMDLFADIDPKESKTHHSARAVELKLQKTELKEEFWPRLLKDAKKVHYLKTDFDKWVDEDEQEGVPDDDYMNQFGGGGGGMPGMGGMGGDGGFGGLDFSKLGGAGGMPDLGAMGDMAKLGGMGGMGGMGEDDDEDDDEEEMPDLEEETAPAAASASKSGSKIEEIE